MSIVTKVSVETKRTTELQLSGDAIAKLLMDAHPELFLGKNLSYTVTLDVPTGGDWSGMTLHIGNEAMVTVKINSQETSGE